MMMQSMTSRLREAVISLSASLWYLSELWSVCERGFAQCDAMGTPPPTSICDTRDGDDEDGDNSGKFDDDGNDDTGR